MKKFLPRPALFVGFCFGFIGLVLAQGIENFPRILSAAEKIEEILQLQWATTVYPEKMLNPNCLENYEEWPNSNKRKRAPWDLNFIINQYQLGRGGPINQFIDVNGDGLNDYIYHHIYRTDSAPGEGTRNRVITTYEVDGVQLPLDDAGRSSLRMKHSCVNLNTGFGWESTYRCVESSVLLESKQISTNHYHSRYEPRYYGDCADI